MQGYLILLKTIYSSLAHISLVIPAILLVTAIILLIRFPFLDDLLSLPYRVFIWLARVFGLTTEGHKWSVVYDSKTKRPLDPAYVTVHNAQGVEVASMITDINGRFSLILPRGIYTIDVQKTNYAFPSYELRNATTDGKYANLYYGKKIDVVETEQAVTVSIPMDQMGEDWNEQEKKRLNIVSHFSKEEYIIVSQYLYLVVGVALTIVHYAYFHGVVSMWLFGVYIAVALLKALAWLFQPEQYAHSVVLDKHSKQPIGFARITVFREGGTNQILRKVASFEGQFTALVPNGKYYMTIEARDALGNYSLVQTTPVFEVQNGSIGKKFFV